MSSLPGKSALARRGANFLLPPPRLSTPSFSAATLLSAAGAVVTGQLGKGLKAKALLPGLQLWGSDFEAE